jgi:hypothetical protein
MSNVAPDNPQSMRRQDDDWRPARYYPAPRHNGGLPGGLLLTGLVVAGLGVMAWYYLGPDLKRYIKMSNM